MVNQNEGSLEKKVIDQYIGKTAQFRTDGESYVGVLKGADDTHFIIGPYQQVTRNKTIEEAARSLMKEVPSHWRLYPTDHGQSMVLTAATTLYFIEPEQLKK